MNTPSDEAAFLKAIQADPADATAKLVYADWLDEHGEPERAAYVRREAIRSNAYEPFRSGYYPGVGAAWLALFHNSVPLWDPVTLLALGRLDGWLAAFAKCSQHSANIVYGFQANLLPRHGSLQSMVAEWFGADFQPIQFEQFSDWHADLRQELHTQLLVELGKVTGGPAHPGWSDTQLALQVEDGRGWIIDEAMEHILAVIRPTSGWRVQVTPKGFYALDWADFVLEADDRVLFLHFSFSD